MSLANLSIIEKDDLIRKMPKDSLQQELRQPSGNFPLYMIAARLKEVEDMEKEATARQMAEQSSQEAPTVAARLAMQAMPQGAMSSIGAMPSPQPRPDPQGQMAQQLAGPQQQMPTVRAQRGLKGAYAGDTAPIDAEMIAAAVRERQRKGDPRLYNLGRKAGFEQAGRKGAAPAAQIAAMLGLPSGVARAQERAFGGKSTLPPMQVESSPLALSRKGFTSPTRGVAPKAEQPAGLDLIKMLAQLSDDGGKEELPTVFAQSGMIDRTKAALGNMSPDAATLVAQFIQNRAAQESEVDVEEQSSEAAFGPLDPVLRGKLSRMQELGRTDVMAPSDLPPAQVSEDVSGSMIPAGSSVTSAPIQLLAGQDFSPTDFSPVVDAARQGLASIRNNLPSLPSVTNEPNRMLANQNFSPTDFKPAFDAVRRGASAVGQKVAGSPLLRPMPQEAQDSAAAGYAAVLDPIAAALRGDTEMAPSEPTVEEVQSRLSRQQSRAGAPQRAADTTQAFRDYLAGVGRSGRTRVNPRMLAQSNQQTPTSDSVGGLTTNVTFPETVSRGFPLGGDVFKVPSDESTEPTAARSGIVTELPVSEDGLVGPSARLTDTAPTVTSKDVAAVETAAIDIVPSSNVGTGKSEQGTSVQTLTNFTNKLAAAAPNTDEAVEIDVPDSKTILADAAKMFPKSAERRTARGKIVSDFEKIADKIDAFDPVPKGLKDIRGMYEKRLEALETSGLPFMTAAAAVLKGNQQPLVAMTNAMIGYTAGDEKAKKQGLKIMGDIVKLDTNIATLEQAQLKVEVEARQKVLEARSSQIEGNAADERAQISTAMDLMKNAQALSLAKAKLEDSARNRANTLAASTFKVREERERFDTLVGEYMKQEGLTKVQAIEKAYRAMNPSSLSRGGLTEANMETIRNRGLSKIDKIIPKLVASFNKGKKKENQLSSYETASVGQRNQLVIDAIRGNKVPNLTPRESALILEMLEGSQSGGAPAAARPPGENKRPIDFFKDKGEAK